LKTESPKNKFKFLVFLAFLLIFFVPSLAMANSDPLKINQTVWGEVGRSKGIDPYLLYSIALVENRRVWNDGKVRPWPWTIYARGKGYYPETREEALKLLQDLLAVTQNVDIGLLQVNFGYHQKKVTAPEDLLDFRKNIETGAEILKIAMNSTQDPILGVGRYHSWREERAKYYGQRVVSVYHELKKRGNEDGSSH